MLLKLQVLQLNYARFVPNERRLMLMLHEFSMYDINMNLITISKAVYYK